MCVCVCVCVCVCGVVVVCIVQNYLYFAVYLREFRHDAFEDLVRRAYPGFGEDWKFMTRFLFPSVDEADQVIDKIEADSLYKDSLIGLAWQAIEKCRQEYDEEATTKRLLAAIHHLNKKKIMDPKNFETSYFGKTQIYHNLYLYYTMRCH